MEQTSGLGNPQRSLQDQMCWLGGIIDGEGMITAMRRSDGWRKDAPIASPRISIVNTERTMIDEIVDILHQQNLPHFVQSKPPTTRGWKTKYEILISGFKRCRRALPVLIPYLVTKKRRAEVMLDWIHYRLSRPERSQYTEEDYRYIGGLRIEHGPVNRSETTRAVSGPAGVRHELLTG